MNVPSLLTILLLKDIWVVSSFGPLQINLHSHIDFCGSIGLHFSGINAVFGNAQSWLCECVLKGYMSRGDPWGWALGPCVPHCPGDWEGQFMRSLCIVRTCLWNVHPQILSLLWSIQTTSLTEFISSKKNVASTRSKHN